MQRDAMGVSSKFETRLLATFAAAMLAAALLAATTWTVSRDAAEAASRVTHTYEVLDAIAQMRECALLIESTTRGYIISGNPRPLAERDLAISTRETGLRRIKDLTADNPRQQERWTRLRQLADERLAISGRAVLLRQTEGFEAARDYGTSAPVLETRERYLQVLGEMEKDERQLLEQRSAELLRALRIRVATSAITVLALVVLVTAAYFRIRRQVRATEAARHALELAHTRVRSILDTAVDGIITIDNRGIVETINPAAERLFGYSAAEVVGHNVKMLMPEPYQSAHDGYIQRYRATGQAHIIGIGREVTGQRKDASTFPMELAIGEMRLDGESHFTGVVRDITERKRVAAALRESEESLFATLHSIGDAVLATDLDGRITRMNPVAERLTGWPLAEALGQSIDAVFRIVNEQTRAPAVVPVAKVLATGEIHGLANHTVLIARDGTAWPIADSAAPIRDGDGRVSGVVLVFRDETDQRRAEQEMRRLNETLKEANRAKSDFLANMSHELRTPLNSIIGFSELLKDGMLGELDAKQRGFVADIFDAGSHLLSLINDILDLSKVEAGMQQIEARAVDVAALLNASTLVVREKAAVHRIRLDTQLDPTLGTMLADERKLKQILYNLLSNAVKFTPEGGMVTLHAHRCTRAEVALDEALPGRLIALPPGEDSEFLAIVVEDTGEGIAAEHLPKLFEPFTQVDSSVARHHGGTGLGLSLVRRLAELHGGTVGVTSQPGVGSRFCVWLPYRAGMPAAQKGETASAATAPSVPAVPLALVIEDDDRTAELIAAQLRAEGFRVMRAATAEEGLVRAAKRRPQLITLDIFLPAMDGWEFLRRIKADPKLADIPVVIITVSNNLDRGLALGARRVLQKPFEREQLLAALAGLIDARSKGESARVLVVDDNVQAVEMLATALEAEGYRVLRAYGGTEAIEVARRVRPDLVILDLMMPDVNGFEVAHALRESEHTARIPILVLTAKDLSAADHARLNSYVSAILEKSDFGTGDLLAELRRALPRHAKD